MNTELLSRQPTDTETIYLERCQAPEPWECVLMRISSFPAISHEADLAKRMIGSLSQIFLKQGLHSHVFIQIESLHRGDGPSRIAQNGRRWLPEPGLGVWPNREAPTYWTKADLEDLDEGQEPRNLMDQVFRVSSDQEGREHARNEMLGIGTLIELMTSEFEDALFEQGRSVLLSRIEEPGLRAFSFYIPLIDRDTVKSATTHLLDEWTCGARVYIRESVAEKGILFLVREPLQPIFDELGLRRQANTESIYYFEN